MINTIALNEHIKFDSLYDWQAKGGKSNVSMNTLDLETKEESNLNLQNESTKMNSQSKNNK